VVLAPATGPANARLCILPYPRDLEETLDHPTLGPLTLRPLRPEDEKAHREFLLQDVLPNELRLRLGSPHADFSHTEVCCLLWWFFWVFFKFRIA
jgi:acetyl-CoA synthetase (ADP-forming)